MSRRRLLMPGNLLVTVSHRRATVTESLFASAVLVHLVPVSRLPSERGSISLFAGATILLLSGEVSWALSERLPLSRGFKQKRAPMPEETAEQSQTLNRDFSRKWREIQSNAWSWSSDGRIGVKWELLSTTRRGDCPHGGLLTTRWLLELLDVWGERRRRRTGVGVNLIARSCVSAQTPSDDNEFAGEALQVWWRKFIQQAKLSQRARDSACDVA